MQDEFSPDNRQAQLDYELKSRQVEAEIAAKTEELKLQSSKQAFDMEQAKAKAAHDANLENQARQDKKEEQANLRRKELCDRFLTIIPVIVALIGPTYGFIQFLKTQASAQEAIKHSEEVTATAKHETAMLEVRKAFITRRFVEYSALVKVTGTFIREEKNSLAFKKAQNEFEDLYWTRLPLVEDEAVEDACVNFRDALEEYVKRGGPPGIEDKKANIRDRALSLSKAVRPSLISVYAPLSPINVTLPAPPSGVGTNTKK